MHFKSKATLFLAYHLGGLALLSAVKADVIVAYNRPLDWYPSHWVTKGESIAAMKPELSVQVKWIDLIRSKLDEVDNVYRRILALDEAMFNETLAKADRKIGQVPAVYPPNAAMLDEYRATYKRWKETKSAELTEELQGYDKLIMFLSGNILARRQAMEHKERFGAWNFETKNFANEAGLLQKLKEAGDDVHLQQGAIANLAGIDLAKDYMRETDRILKTVDDVIRYSNRRDMKGYAKQWSVFTRGFAKAIGKNTDDGPGDVEGREKLLQAFLSATYESKGHHESLANVLEDLKALVGKELPPSFAEQVGSGYGKLNSESVAYLTDVTMMTHSMGKWPHEPKQHTLGSREEAMNTIGLTLQEAERAEILLGPLKFYEKAHEPTHTQQLHTFIKAKFGEVNTESQQLLDQELHHMHRLSKASKL